MEGQEPKGTGTLLHRAPALTSGTGEQLLSATALPVLEEPLRG